jgi:hypothetical protein
VQALKEAPLAPSAVVTGAQATQHAAPQPDQPAAEPPPTPAAAKGPAKAKGARKKVPVLT